MDGRVWFAVLASILVSTPLAHGQDELQPFAGWHTTFIQIAPGNGADDIRIESTSEAHVLASEIAETGNTGVLSNGSTYNVVAYVDELYREIDFAGRNGAGNFQVNNRYPGEHGGANFVVSAHATVTIPEGTYTINVGSDDGNSVTFPGATFDSLYWGERGSSELTGWFTDSITWEDDRPWRNSGGAFVVPEGGREYQVSALFWERTSSDAWEISIAPGVHDLSSIQGGQLLDEFQLLSDEVYGISLSTSMAVTHGVAPSLIVGDLDRDGSVSFADFLILNRHYQVEGGPANGDINNDGQINFRDFLLLSENFGQSVEVSNVPEPSTVLSLLWFFLPVVRFRHMLAA